MHSSLSLSRRANIPHPVIDSLEVPMGNARESEIDLFRRKLEKAVRLSANEACSMRFHMSFLGPFTLVGLYRVTIHDYYLIIYLGYKVASSYLQ